MRLAVPSTKRIGAARAAKHTDSMRLVSWCRRATGITDDAEIRAEVEKIEKRLAEGLSAFETSGLSFEDAVELYSSSGMTGLASSTGRARRAVLDGPLTAYFGETAVADIGTSELARWWDSEITHGVIRHELKDGSVKERPVGRKTGINHLDALSGLFRFVIKSTDAMTTNPVTAFREEIRESQGKNQRAARDATRDIRVIESPAAIEALLKEPASDNDSLAALLMLDAGLRAGEVGGLRWGDVWWGRSDSDRSRHLHICNNNPAGGGKDEVPKSGKSRPVELSRRLRSTLREEWVRLGQPESGYVVQGFDAANFSKRFAKRCQKAGIGSYRPKDLRSSFASHLLSLGIPLSYIQRQLGHLKPQTTSDYYARYIPEGYVSPPPLEPGEVPADLLARLRTIDCQDDVSRDAQ